MIRLLIYLFTRRWGLIVVGALLAIVGLIYGASSHPVTYQSVNKETVAHFLSDNSSSSDHKGYLQMVNDSRLYVINENDFSPNISGNSFGDGDMISFVYRQDQTSTIDVSATNTSTHLQGSAYTIEQITVFGTNGQSSAVYTTSEYSQNPKGSYENNWPVGGGLLAAGLIIVGLAFLIPMLRGRKKPQDGYGPSASMGMGTQPQVNPYQQPYQNPAQYPQYSQQPYQGPAQYPPQPGQYNSPQGPPPQPAQYPQSQFQPWPGQSNPPQGPPPQPPQYPQQPGQQSPQQGGPYGPTERANPYDTPSQG